MSSTVQPATLEEIVTLGAVDTEVFSHAFFPDTVRQESAPFHPEVDRLLESAARLVNVQIFRGGAKTTKLRVFTAKRIGYGISRTILYIGKSEGHAIYSISWLKRQIEHNRRFTTAFGLSRGEKWTDTEIEIRHAGFDQPIWIMGMGITGSIRGINRDDYRPDLIVIDDVVDEENGATVEQREKISNLVYGGLKQSLAPASESPLAKMVALQTPIHKEDYSTLALNDMEWVSAKFGCWTPDTTDLPVNLQESSWPSRFPSQTLRDEKRAAAARNKLSTFVREMELKLISAETAAFKGDWLKFFDLLPEQATKIMVIDPVPPADDAKVQKGLHKRDFEALSIIARKGNDFYVVEYATNRGHDPSWTIAEFFRLAMKYNPIRVYVEGVAYQRTLSWLLRKAMEHQRRWFVIETFDDKRRKYDKITDGLSGPAAAGHLWCRKDQTEFIQQFNDYPSTSHDDVLETVALGVTNLQNIGFSADEDEDAMGDIALGIKPLSYQRGAP